MNTQYISSLPMYPVPATIGVMFREGRVLLVQRKNPPDAGRWGLPGGKIHVGETIFEAAIREIHEETAVDAAAVRVVTALDCLDVRDGLLRQHFTLIAVLCKWLWGEPKPGDDALQAQWFAREELEHSGIALSRHVLDVIRLAERMD